MDVEERRDMGNIFIKIKEFFERTFQGSSEEVEIKLQGRVSLEDDTEGFLATLQPAFEAFRKGSANITLDLTEAEFLYPSALIFLLALNEAQGQEVNLRVKEGSALHNYLRFCGASKYFEMTGVEGSTTSGNPFDSKVFELRVLSDLSDTQKVALEIVDLIKSEQPMSGSVESAVIDSLDEILRNTRQHSGFNHCILLGQTYPTSHRLRLVIYDNGVGIKEHLTKVPYEERHKQLKELITKSRYEEMQSGSSNIAIEEASRYMVSGTDYQKNSGAGLPFLIDDLSKPTKGTVMILSGDGWVRWDMGTMKKSKALPVSMKGTLISVTIEYEPESILVYKSEVNGK